MGNWIHEIKDAMLWQESNYILLKKEYEDDQTPEKRDAYIKSYGEFCKLEGKYEQWHKDQQEQ